MYVQIVFDLMYDGDRKRSGYAGQAKHTILYSLTLCLSLETMVYGIYQLYKCHTVRNNINEKYQVELNAVVLISMLKLKPVKHTFIVKTHGAEKNKT